MVAGQLDDSLEHVSQWEEAHHRVGHVEVAVLEVVDAGNISHDVLVRQHHALRRARRSRRVADRCQLVGLRNSIL